MKLVIIDGQSGRMGALLAERIKAAKLPCEVLAVGTNAIATAAMMKAGADQGATGENPVLVACRTADIIAGPIGILSADALLGEITPAIAVAIGSLTSFFGAWLSYYLDGATGGIIVVAQTLLFLITFIFAPKHGLLASRRRAREAAC